MLPDLKWPGFHASGHTASEEYTAGSSEGYVIYFRICYSLQSLDSVMYFRMIIYKLCNEVLLSVIASATVPRMT